MLYGNLRTVILIIRCLIIAVTVTVFWDLGSGNWDDPYSCQRSFFGEVAANAPFFKKKNDGS